MSRILVGGISPESEVLLHNYLNTYMPDATIEPLKSVGIKGKLKTQGGRPDVLLIILDETLYASCVGTCDEVLSLPKVHKYINEDGFSEFLISKFGKLEGTTETGIIPPDQLMSNDTDEDFGDSSYIAMSTTDTDDKDAEINKLRDKLAQAELNVRNLTMQLEEASDNNDLSDFVKKIRSLEEELQKKNEELNALVQSSSSNANSAQAQAEVESLKAELKKLKEDSADLDFKRKKAEEELETVRGTFYSYKDKIEQQEAEIKKLETQIYDNDQAYDELYTTLNTTSAELRSKNAELELLQQSKSELSGSITELEISKHELDEKTLELNNLTVDFKKSEEKIAELNEKIESLNEDLLAKDNEIASKNKEVQILNDSCKDSDKQISELNAKVSEKEAELESLRVSLGEQASKEVSELSASIAELNGKVSALESELQDKISANTTLEEEKKALESEVKDKTAEVKELNGQLILKEDELEVKNNLLENAINEKKEVESKLDSTSESLDNARAELNVVKTTLTEKDNLLSESSNKMSDLSTEKEKLENQITVLKENLEEAKKDAETMSKLEDELLEEKRKVTKMTAELEVLKSADNSGRTSELREEISKLKAENMELQKQSSSEMEKELRTELKKAREKASNLESDLAEQVELVNELNDSIFMKMAYIASPKLACDIDLGVGSSFLDKRVYCVSSGSLESNNRTYRLIRQTIERNQNMRFLIIDLVTDSFADRELGVQKINSPINWLNGSADFKEFVAPTKYNNAKCISTGFAFINDLYLLQVDWEKRISEIVGFGDVVIFHIGSLNNTVTKVLYNTFSSIMRSNIVVNATPINLRTLILSMTGLKKSDNTMVCCVNFDETLSQPMYQKLIQKYKATIFSEADILKV